MPTERPGAPTFPHASRVGFRIVLVAVGASGFICHDPGPPPPPPIPPPPPPPAITRVEIQPGAFQVAVGRSFEITTRAFDAQGHVVPLAGPVLTWKIEGANPEQLELLSHDGGSARFQAKHDAGTPVKVVATHGFATAIAAATIVPAAIGSSEVIDVLEAPHEDLTLLSYALLSGERTDKPAVNEPVAFAAGARVENLTGAGTFAVFSPSRRVFHATVADWKDGQRTESAPSGTGTEPVVVPVHLWDATDDGLTLFPDLMVARLIYRTSRTGIGFSEVGGDPLPIRLAPASVVAENCEAPEAVFGTVFDPTQLALHVFVTQSLDNGNLLGWACRPSADPSRKARAIFLSLGRFTTTLAHELGHVLALLEPAGGHADCAPGFDETNLMWRWLSDQQSSNRMDLSLGQAYRIALDRRSWAAVLGMGAINPGPSCDVAGTCPPLSHPIPEPDVWVPPGYCTP